MSEQTVVPKATSKKSSVALWMLMLTFALPITAAYVYFIFGDHQSTSNHGELINPVIDIETLALKDSMNNPMSREHLTHKWRMIYIVGKGCDDSCSKSLYHMRQINIALGKNQDRFQHMIIHTGTMNPDFSKLVKAEYPAALHGYSETETLLKIFSTAETEFPSNSIYIMDPIGNIMMRFSPEVLPKFILKDVNHLLKVSRIG